MRRGSRRTAVGVALVALATIGACHLDPLARPFPSDAGADFADLADAAGDAPDAASDAARADADAGDAKRDAAADAPAETADAPTDTGTDEGAVDAPWEAYVPPGPVGGHALFVATDGQYAEVIDYEGFAGAIWQTEHYETKDIRIYGRRGIVRYIDPEHGLVHYPEEGYNYMHVGTVVDVNPWAVPPGYVPPAKDAGADSPADGAVDAGAHPAYATVPVASVPGPNNTDFVFARERNDVVVVDAATIVYVTPTGTIDLSAFLHPDDHDGKLEPVDALFDPTLGLLFVVLARIDRTRSSWPVDLPGCAASAPILLAIHPILRVAVDLTPGVAGDALPLLGHTPVALELEPVSQKLHVLTAGCVADDAGAVVGRGIETLSLAGLGHALSLDLSTAARPTRLLVEAEDLALIAFDDGRVARWDTAQATLGADVASPPAAFASLGQGWILGVEPQTIEGGVKDGLTLVDTVTGERFLRDAPAFNLPGTAITPNGPGYGWH